MCSRTIIKIPSVGHTTSRTGHSSIHRPRPSLHNSNLKWERVLSFRSQLTDCQMEGRGGLCCRDCDSLAFSQWGNCPGPGWRWLEHRLRELICSRRLPKVISERPVIQLQTLLVSSCTGERSLYEYVSNRIIIETYGSIDNTLRFRVAPEAKQMSWISMSSCGSEAPDVSLSVWTQDSELKHDV